MAFEATCTSLGERVMLRIRQSGWDASPRWTRYYDLLASNLTLSLNELKSYVESRA
jgi:hypothetical protein